MAQAPLDPDNDWRIKRYLNWLCTPADDREPRLKSQIAEELGVTHRTLNTWHDNRDFLKAWEKLYLKTIGDPGVKLKIMQALEQTATDPDDPKHVQAAKTYFEIEGSMKPQKMDVTVTKDPTKLTDEQLDGLLAAGAQNELDRRKAASGE